MIRYLIATIILFTASKASCFVSINSDTIPPVFTAAGTDLSINCTSSLVLVFSNWYNNSAGIRADNGEASVLGVLTLEEALSQLDSLHATECMQGLSVDYGFVAIDSCNNQSIDTSFVTFQFVDNQAPLFVQPPQSKSLDCDYGIRDSLQFWIDAIGGANIQDNCSDTIVVSSYSWLDSNGNSGFGNLNVPTNIIIERTSCLWHVDVTFFVEDECGNIRSGTARFAIVSDGTPPDVTMPPGDTIIGCDSALPLSHPVFIDGCDNIIPSTLSVSNSQVADTLSCGFYQYQLNRTWLATDACGNSSVYTQSISVVDSIAPTIEFDPIVAFDCDEAIDESMLIQVEDNCSSYTTSFRDSLIASNICQEQLIRFWEVSDVCGNVSEFEQTIQIQDFSIPVFAEDLKDTIIDCSQANPSQIFDNWLDELLLTEVVDNCSEIKKFVAKPGQYSDTTSIKSAPRPTLEIVICPAMNSAGVLGTQEVRLLTFDQCGNIAGRSAFFTIIDTIAPQIVICPPNRGVTLAENFCSRNTRLLLPIIQDNCVQITNDNWYIEFEGERILFSHPDSIFVDLEVGSHAFDYEFTDCAGNKISCSNMISVRDTFPPVLTCPPDISLYASSNNCKANYEIGNILNYSDNCQGPLDYFKIKPNNSGLTSFTYDAADSLYKANDIILSFDDVDPSGIVFKPRLTLEYALNITAGSRVTINSELGDLLHTITEADCVNQTVIIDLNANQFNFWAVDGQVKFTVIHQDGTGKGTIACRPQNISGQQGTDGKSFVRIALEYSDITADYELRNATTGALIATPNPQIDLNVGTYNLRYTSLDRNNNEGNCVSRISVIDTISPVLSCQAIKLTAPIGPESQFPILASQLKYAAADNCQIDSIRYSPQTFDCSMVGQTIPLTIEVVDVNGNTTACVADASIQSQKINLSFSSNLCFADTLKLFSGVDDALVANYNWSGPDDFESTSANPTLNTISTINSGIYRLTIETIGGCFFSGEIDIQVNDFVSPQIMADSMRYCLGQQVLFNASIYSENVDYFWYEGISPNGILIQQTSGPSFQLTPSLGEHFYYVEVRSEECSSNPSNTISINVLPQPVASVTNPFITICEGMNIMLQAENINQDFNYTWTGPNAYNSTGPIPQIISNASEVNQGNYFLTISNGSCVSDTATVQVVLFELPPRPIITGDNIFCEGQSAVLTVANVNNAIRYHWYKDGLLFSSVSSNSLLIPSINQSHSGEWTVIVEDGLCVSLESRDFEVFVESSLNIGASNNGPLCEGDIVNLTSSFIPNANYQWRDPSGIIYNGREISVPAIEGIYTVTVTTTSNCSATATTQVEVAIRPEITALSNTSLQCMSPQMSVTFVPTVFPAGNYEYEWSGPQGFSSAAKNPVINNVMESQNGLYKLVIKSGNCESDTVSTLLNVTIIPNAPIITGNIEPCEGDTVLLKVQNPVTSGSRRWIWSTPLGQRITTVPQLQLLNFDAQQVGSYSAFQEKNSCRSAQSNILNLNFLANPAKPTIQGNRILCQGETLTLVTQTFANAEYVWFTPNGTVNTASNQLSISDIGPASQGLYSVLIRKGNCISENSAAVNVVIKSRPVAPRFDIGSIELCENEDVLSNICLSNNPVNADNIQIIDLQSGIKIQEGDTQCFDLSFLNNGNNKQYRIAAIAENDGCFSQVSDTLYIQIYEIPQMKALIEQDLQIICDQEFANSRVGSSPSGITWQWTSPDPEINIFDAFSLQASFSNLREGNNQVILWSSNGLCQNYASDTSRIFVINEIVANDDIFEDEVNGTVLIDVLDNDIYNQQVTISNITIPGEGQARIINNLIEFTPPNNYVGLVRIDYEICYLECPDFCDDATLEIKLGDNIACFAGNVVTPNGDGYNDFFEIPCLETGNFQSNELYIFNQWGDEIFNASPYLNNWDARYEGKVLPVGTYFYILNLGDGSKNIQGFIIVEL